MSDKSVIPCTEPGWHVEDDISGGAGPLLGWVVSHHRFNSTAMPLFFNEERGRAQTPEFDQDPMRKSSYSYTVYPPEK